MKLKYYKALLFVVVIQFSCSKSYLDTPSGGIARQEYFTNLNNARNYLNGIYIDLAQYFYNGYGTIYTDLAGDNIKPAGSVLNTHYSWAQIANTTNTTGVESGSSNMNGLWIAGYSIARNASYILENIDGLRSENPLKADSIKGQAFALRALAHFQMVNVFAQPYNYSADGSHEGIPYVTVSDFTKPVVKETVAEVYNKLIEDLNNAIPLLPSGPQGIDKLVITKNAGKAFLARVYLFKNDLNNAKALSVEVAGSVPMMTIAGGYPGSIWKAFATQTESLFQLPPSENPFTTNFPGRYFYNGTNIFFASSGVANILNERTTDVRKNWTTLVTGNYGITKFPAGLVSGISVSARSYYLTVIRSSEMFLTAAECFAKLGDETNAKVYLDAVRKRADNSISPVVATGAALIDSIYKERRKELCFENLRLFDLQRTGSSINRLDAPAGYADLPYPSEHAIAPIPSGDVTLSGLKQNVGY